MFVHPHHKKRMSQGNLVKQSAPPSLLSKEIRRPANDAAYKGEGKKKFNNANLYQQIEDTLMKQQVVNESLLEKKIHKLNRAVHPAMNGKMRNLLNFNPTRSGERRVGHEGGGGRRDLRGEGCA